jgi:PIN like domain
MAIQFYFDADVLGVAKLLVQVRSDVTYPGDPGDGTRPACGILPDTKDEIWIPAVSNENWVVVTRDRHIMSRPQEVAAVRANYARIVCLDARHELSKWLELEIVVTQWRRIEELSSQSGPWIYQASRTTMKKKL